MKNTNTPALTGFTAADYYLQQAEAALNIEPRAQAVGSVRRMTLGRCLLFVAPVQHWAMRRGLRPVASTGESRR